MLNNLILVGRMVDDPKVKVFDDGVKVCNFVLAVDRPFKNQETGGYDTDFIKISVWRGFVEAMITYCRKGSTVGIKGRISSKVNDVNGIKINQLEVIAERVSFISLKNGESTQKNLPVNS